MIILRILFHEYYDMNKFLITEVINVEIGEFDQSVPDCQRKFFVNSHPMVS